MSTPASERGRVRAISDPVHPARSPRVSILLVPGKDDVPEVQALHELASLCQSTATELVIVARWTPALETLRSVHSCVCVVDTAPTESVEAARAAGARHASGDLLMVARDVHRPLALLSRVLSPAAAVDTQ